ncbi:MULTISPECIES: hypothetical protein, partial [unclassified Mesorhizobium]|uniref:hypothetical protein n=1 Tax=unclassified Mesorhizobium TaxID=325217 RepID=UPI00112B514B
MSKQKRPTGRYRQEIGHDPPLVRNRCGAWHFDQNGPVDGQSGNDYDPAQNWEADMNYQRFFEDAIDQLHAERRYRVFA